MLMMLEISLKKLTYKTKAKNIVKHYSAIQVLSSYKQDQNNRSTKDQKKI